MEITSESLRNWEITGILQIGPYILFDPFTEVFDTCRHGTRCAGEVAALAGNNQCGVGVAFKAKIGGVRMLDGAVSDSVEAASLSLNQVPFFSFLIFEIQIS